MWVLSVLPNRILGDLISYDVLNYELVRQDMLAVTSIHKDVGVIVVGHQTNYPYPLSGDWALYAYLFNATGVEGTDFGTEWLVRPGLFPDQTYNSWYGSVASPNVLGYNHVDWLGGPAIQVKNITSFSWTFDWSFEGSGAFNQLNEIWIGRSGLSSIDWTTSQGGSITNAAWFELGQINHYGTEGQAFHNGGTLIGTHSNGGVSYNVRLNGRFFTLAPPSDVMSGTFDMKALFDWLVYLGRISGSEWLSGNYPLFGIEPHAAATVQHSGNWTIDDINITFTGTQVTEDLSYLGTDQFGVTFEDQAMTPTSSQPDAYGGSTARRLLETTANSAHGRFIAAGNNVIPTREAEGWMAFDVEGVGRTDFQIWITNSSFSDQKRSDFSTTNLTAIQDTIESDIGTDLTILDRQIIRLTNNVYRLLVRFRKNAGITQLFVQLRTGNGSAFSFVGDVSKGMIVHDSQYSFVRLITLSGTPPAGTTGVAYSFTPTVKNGQGTLAFSATGLPTGWSINTTTGEVSGTTSSSGTANFTISVTGDDGSAGSQAFSAAVTAAPLTTWDPANLGAAGALSESNRRLISSGSSGGTRSTSSRLTGKYYAEIEGVTVFSGAGIGLVNSSGSYAGWIGGNNNGVGYDPAGGVYRGGSLQSGTNPGVMTSGQVLCIKYDADARKVEFGRNGSFNGTLYDVPTGSLFLAAQGGSTFSVRIRTEVSQFSYSVPNGYSAWN